MPDGIIDLSLTSEVLLQDFGYFEAGAYNIHDITISDYFPQTFNIRFITYYNPDSMEINPSTNYSIGAWDPTDQFTPKFQVQVDFLYDDSWISFDTGIQGGGTLTFNRVEDNYREGYFEFTAYAYDQDFNPIAQLDALGQFFANERYHPGEDRQMSLQKLKIEDVQLSIEQ